MNGPEHYREAQQLLEELRRGLDAGNSITPQEAATHAARAQVHATLALTAATVWATRDKARTTVAESVANDWGAVLTEGMDR